MKCYIFKKLVAACAIMVACTSASAWSTTSKTLEISGVDALAITKCVRYVKQTDGNIIFIFYDTCIRSNGANPVVLRAIVNNNYLRFDFTKIAEEFKK